MFLFFLNIIKKSKTCVNIEKNIINIDMTKKNYIL